MKTAVQTNLAPQPVGPYSQAVKVGNYLFTCQLGLDTSGNFPSQDIAVQTRQTLENIKLILEAAGYEMNDIVKTTIYLSDMNDFATVNDIYREYFDSPYPARACIQAARLPKDGKIEIEAIAVE